MSLGSNLLRTEFLGPRLNVSSTYFGGVDCRSHNMTVFFTLNSGLFCLRERFFNFFSWVKIVCLIFFFLAILECRMADGIHNWGSFCLSTLRLSSQRERQSEKWFLALPISFSNKPRWKFNTDSSSKQPLLGILKLRNFGIICESRHFSTWFVTKGRANLIVEISIY